MYPNDIRSRRFRLIVPDDLGASTDTVLMRVVYSCNLLCKIEPTNASAERIKTLKQGFEYYADHYIKPRPPISKTRDGEDDQGDDVWNENYERLDGLADAATNGCQSEWPVEQRTEDHHAIAGLPVQKAKDCGVKLCVSDRVL